VELVTFQRGTRLITGATGSLPDGKLHLETRVQSAA
jgi:hypothetical protein